MLTCSECKNYFPMIVNSRLGMRSRRERCMVIFRRLEKARW